ncbi:MAG: hypothetical protein P1U56_22420 [Saprospiraceae bacterium]|nr:hypothetical protein [Saprospiraceae bacterium]
MKKRIFFYIFGFTFFILALLILRPVTIPSDPADCLVAEGKVVYIFEGGPQDINFRLEGDKTMYYINRGMDYGLNIDSLRNQLMGNDITIRYPKHWTLLDPKGRNKHLSILEFNGKELFNEIELIKNKKG